MYEVKVIPTGISVQPMPCAISVFESDDVIDAVNYAAFFSIERPQDVVFIKNPDGTTLDPHEF